LEDIMKRSHGIVTTRRAFLGSSLATVLAAGWPRLLSAATLQRSPRPRRLIFLYLNGGPSHIDTFDPKPGTRAGGPFKAIRTALSGHSFSEHLPRLAERAGDLVVLRSVTSREGSHERARYLMHTGFSPIPGSGFPCVGSTLSNQFFDRSFALPSYVCLGGTGEGAGLFGPEHEPFVVRRNTDGKLPYLAPFGGVSDAALAARGDLTRTLDQRFGARTDPDLATRQGSVLDRASRLMATPLTAAFDWKREPEAVLKAYGDNAFGHNCLTARRLIEAGVTCVEVELDGWDSHKHNFTTHADLCQKLDPAMSKLIDDLKERDLFSSTLIVCGGEFGRGPSINSEEGRDHHPACFSMVMAGGGLKRGVVLGQSDASGDKPVGTSVSIPDILTTLFHVVGIDPDKTYQIGDRPIRLGNGGKLLKPVLT
jgi:hypothetical protein